MLFIYLCSAPPPVILGVGNTDVSCYTCDNEPDNDRCNGAHVSFHSTGFKTEGVSTQFLHAPAGDFLSAVFGGVIITPDEF